MLVFGDLPQDAKIEFNRGKFVLTESDMSKLFQDRLFLNLVNRRKGQPQTLNALYKQELPKLEALIKLIEKSQ